MVVINEWLPNPAGEDAQSEWVELYNAGDAPVSLSGWQVVNEGGKSYSLSGQSMGVHEHLLLPRSATKLTLRNRDGGLFLYQGGELRDSLSFQGSAREGYSLVRVSPEARHALFSDTPTPGASNVLLEIAAPIENFSYGVPVNAASLGAFEVLSTAFGVGLFFAALGVYLAFEFHALRDYFVKKN